ncbi:MAG: Stp1/IreP family PP2C-type Ser/Thr phosphatase [Nitrospiraceae bacterium]|nr:Stp1/IreP family PP2C-type Ser/Thr phosphatase [Nitrospiraceae bacterium]
MKLRYLASGQTDKGIVRANNEDFFCVEEKSGLFAVADGIGGFSAGEIASRMAIDIIRDYISKSEDNPEKSTEEKSDMYSEAASKLASAIRLANSSIYEAAQKNDPWRGMGTTIAAALIKENRLSIAHVGDSRAYLIRGNNIEQLTDDHSLISEQLKKGLITEKDAGESNFKNIITRSLGRAASVDMDIAEITLMNNDSILLCTDGLTAMVPDNIILSTVRLSSNPDLACRRLIDIANKNGGKDNISVVIVYISGSRFSDILKNFINRMVKYG